MTTTYFLIGRRIVEEEQRGEQRAGYGEQLIERLAADLTKRFGRGFSRRNLFLMRAFFLDHREIVQTPSAQSFPLPWSHYVRLMPLGSPDARRFYEREALKGGWTFKQLDRQVQTQFYERTALSKKKLKAHVEPEEPTFKEPYLLEFLDLKDEYTENDLEDALVSKLESFLMELGSDFAFIGRQKRLRIGEEWYRVDLLLFHRRLRCLVVVDLKLGKFTHADSGQMHVYLRYAKEHWMLEGENPPVGLILCAQGDQALAHYALGGLDSTVLAAEYRTVLPSESALVAHFERVLSRSRELPEAGPRTPRGSAAPASTH
jgi:predicted nuclease of restriction endonuclease-like (RecB) superfamily